MRNLHLPGRSPVFASNAMVATSHPLAASEALDVLRSGGNAADAAIAGAVLLGVCEPQMCGIGGDCFALVKPAGSNEVHALNGSGAAPAGFSADSLRANNISKIEPGNIASVTLPGAIAGFCELSEKFGKVGIDRALAPTIAHFERGVPVAPRVAQDWQPVDEHLRGAARSQYLKKDRPYEIGDVFALPEQADVLRRIAKDGHAGFYTGVVADDMVATLQKNGGTHTHEDFANTRATWDSPVSGQYRGTDLVEHPPNGQGATAILLAQILAEFDIGGLDPNGAERLHLEIEATKLAYDARNRIIADPDYTTRVQHMLDPETAKKLAGLIDLKRAMGPVAQLSESVHKDTVLITVVDRDGMAVSLIYSIFATFGSGLSSDKFGILFHNRGSGFNLIPGHPNEAGPNKRPMHTIIPAMTRNNGAIDMTFGVMGGQYQATGHAHMLSNMIDFGMDVQSAIDAPRVFPETYGLRIEDNLEASVVAKLAELGHEPTLRQEPIGGAQAIQIDHARGILIGGSDPRKDGLAIGY